MGWLGVLVVAAGRSVDTSVWVGLPDLSDLIAVVWLIALVLGTVFILMSSKTTTLPPQATRRGRWFLWITAAALLLLVAANPDLLDRFRIGADEASEIDVTPGIEEAEPEVLPPPDIQIEAIHVYVLLAVLAGSAVFFQWNRRRLAEELVDEVEDEADSLSQQLPDVVRRARGELLQDGEPRRRVLAAYAEVERALAGEKLARHRTETPSEHIARALSAVTIDPAPLVELGHLYELARFSDHPITVDDQQRAAADLERTVQELASVAGTNHNRSKDAPVSGFTS